MTKASVVTRIDNDIYDVGITTPYSVRLKVIIHRNRQCNVVWLNARAIELLT